MSFSQKRYRIEETLRHEPITLPPVLNGGCAVPGAAAGSGCADPRLSHIIEAIGELRQFLDPSQRLASDVIDAYRKEITEVYALRQEIDAMKAAITQTKREIASLYKSDEEGKGMRRVAGELDAVVTATEEATGSILSGLEDIETHVNMLRASGGTKGSGDEIGAILDRVISMYEACNFQDLTGQRITKIVNVLKFVEERLDRMIDVWGGLDAFQELIQHEVLGPKVDDEKALLNGPKLEEDAGHVSQDDIDSLFD
ncbi:protein phosphatase CheZ [Salinarimonas rosea]|uniref:protein phosphatase CheZ n=1 Tax=Salinarimonas rosea TaxID=552063 RepID=UPI0004219CA1|nr:protein phosphatase CheZ [Salinarimonas rosea]